MVRHAERRDRFMDAIDWDSMTGRECLMASFEDDQIEEDLAACEMQVSYFETLRDCGYSDTAQQLSFEPGAPFNVGRASDHPAPFLSADIDAEIAF